MNFHGSTAEGVSGSAKIGNFSLNAASFRRYLEMCGSLKSDR